ncbi:MAG: flagellar biosynthesis anti-sigma factor FlgM [Gammaproteobacteria bacterium]|nr:flagellar biosynthesis anti-sigma factor FlgM [Gammaproteobacteria bacterium]NIR88510.1 flagellar biosynthesis anti-sigma factor FlgM [Gammaproteobacteria bacterium]NIU05174.1 flagellar biosynthesis anti-sigma factor FlgM [Gammaproteobacteria bacterium]NIV52017.1 flagellar biosynthesis anti-sigma factor FlgM [Gammaproteobacteria bacterium]NIW86179.1 flagellar biosynthesis anti-sigma factor FlgM [Gammaproteobacteria bacterium]
MSNTKRVNGARAPANGIPHPIGEPTMGGGDHPSATDAQGIRTDEVELAAKLEELEAALAKIPIVDQRRVEEFRKALAEGAYHVDAVQLADKLIEFERMLNGPGRT